MSTLRILFVLLFLCPMASQAQNAKVIDLTLAGPNSVLSSNLIQGFLMPLDWAANSSVACFPATRFVEYQGNHILYRVQMPASSVMTITVTPKSPKTRINLYALRLGINNMDAPPAISRAISCEASYPIYAGTPNLRAPAKAQSVEYMSIKKPYNIVIGIAGAKGVTEGDFDLQIDVKKR